uniref:Uncharacterized protein n=1 Tax=Myoviridae sp. ctj3P51 TaxID=2826687 RepID=A0A8S5NQA3_9CAUD|nr:MAG TPA: hypothetical protein [Myoviridae sp. ctj3P51]
MIKRKLNDALRETKVKIHGVPFIHRISENKFDTVETWVRADGHGTIRKTDEGKFVARYEMWNDVAKKYETRVIESKDEIEEVVDQMEEDIKEGELKKKAREEGRKRMMGDAVGSKYVIMHPKKKLYLTVGGKTWSEEDDPMIKKFKSEVEAEAYAKKNTTNFRISVFDAKADGTNPNKTTVHDDYGWEIPTDKAWNAFESVKKELGAKKLLSELTEAMGTADVKEAVEDIATDWDEEVKNIGELIELAGDEEVLDALAQWLSYDDLADDLAFICRMRDLHIPELEEEDEIDVDEDIDFDDALWAQPDNDAGSAGILTKTPAIRYKDYLILTREDGMFDVYTRRDFDLVGTEFKSVEEAKKNIDEGRTEQHTTTESEDFDEDEESVEVEEDVEETAKPDPDAKIVNYAGYRIMKQKDGTWTVIKGGLDLESRKPIKTAKNFAEAVEWLYKTDAKIPFPGDKTKSERLIAEYLPAEFKDSVDKVTEADIKPGLVFAYSINPAKHFTVKTPAYDGEVVFESFKKTLHAAKVADLVHDLNLGELILVSKGE